MLIEVGETMVASVIAGLDQMKIYFTFFIVFPP